MITPRRKSFALFVLFSLAVFLAGCIRLWGGAGYVKQTPKERTERVVGFDTAQAFGQKQTEGNTSF